MDVSKHGEVLGVRVTVSRHMGVGDLHEEVGSSRKRRFAQLTQGPDDVVGLDPVLRGQRKTGRLTAVLHREEHHRGTAGHAVAPGDGQTSGRVENRCPAKERQRSD